MRPTISFVAAACAALVAGCAPEPESPTATAAPPAPAGPQGQIITTARGGYIPEGIEYDQANGRFLSGSLAEGTIFEIGLDGSVVPFIRDADLVSSVGIEADEPRDRLLVANSDRAAFGGEPAGQAKLGVYNLTTGERLAMVDLGALLGAQPKYFANDVTVDNEGNAYVTDTMNGVVYRVTPAYQASVLHRFTDLPQGAQLNGIVYHDNGYLLVVAGEHTYKVPVANPAGTTKVNVAEPVAGQDGIVWAADGRLVATSNSGTEPRLVAFRSNDDWATAQRAGVAVLDGQATTAAAAGAEVWAVHPHFNDAERPTLEQAVFQ